MSDMNNLVYICVHCGQVVENKDSDWHDRQCPAKNMNVDDDPDDIELNVDEVEEDTPEEKRVEKDDYVIRLINAVRIRTLLWDKFQKRDLPARQKLWTEIEQELGIQPDVARRDWTHLREKYRNEKYAIGKAAQSGRTLTSKWEYYNQLAFLDQDSAPRRRGRGRKRNPEKAAAAVAQPNVVSTRLVTMNGNNVPNKVRQKPGPKPGSTRKKPVPQKPIIRSRRTRKQTQQPIKINNASDRAKLNELRVVVSRNDFKDLAVRHNSNNISVMNDPSSRKRITQSEVDAVALKKVCIRNSEETQMNSTKSDDTVGKFCSYLEVMLKTLPKEKQEVFYEETLDHLATLKRQIRRSNHSNPATNYM